MKKMSGLLLSGALALVVSTNAVSAASDINASENRLLDYLNNYSYQIGTQKYTVDNDLLSKAKNYLIRDEVNLTEEQVNQVIALADKGFNILVKKGIVIGNKLSDEDANLMVNEVVKPICDILKLSLSYDAANDIITIKNANGDIVYTDDDIIKDTGNNASSSYALMSFLLLAAAGFGYTAYKKSKA